MDEIEEKKHSRKMRVRQFAEQNARKGTWPDSQAAIWALRAKTPENGFADAFLKVGGVVLVDENKFWEAVDKLQKKN